MIKYLFLLQLTILTLTSVAQKNIKKALLITKSNEQIEGVVDDRESFQNTTSISFKQNGTNSFKEINAKDASSIKIEKGNYYFSKKISIDLISDPNFEANQKIDSSVIQFKTETVFVIAKYLSPRISIYSFVDKKNHIYVEKNTDSLTELIHRKYIVKNNDRKFEYEDNAYIITLNELLGDCPAIAEKEKSPKFNLSNIIKLAKEYSTCTGNNPEFVSDSEKDRIYVGVIGGMSKASLLVKAEQPGTIGSSGYIYDEPHTTKPEILIGLRLQYFINTGRQKKLSIISDLYYTKLNATLEKQILYTTPTFYTNRNVSLSVSTIKLDLMGRYSFLDKKKLSPFVNVGISVSSMFKGNGTSTDTDVFSGITIITTKQLLTAQSGKVKKTNIKPIFGLGLAYKNLSLEYRYWNIGGLTQANALYSVNTKLHSFLFCYRFK